MKPFLAFISLTFSISGIHGEAIPLNPENPRYTYYAGNDGEDAHAVLAGLFFNSQVKCYSNVGQQGSLSYIFEVAAGASGLRIKTNGFTRNNGRSAIEATCSVDGGQQKILFNTGRSIADGLEIDSSGIPNFENGNEKHFISDGTIDLDPLKKHTIEITISSNGYGDWNEQVLRGGGRELFDEDGNPQSLIVTALVPGAIGTVNAAPASASESAPPFRSLTGDPGIEFEVVEFQERPVIDRAHPDCEDDKYGFEGGVVVKLNGTYHMFTAENPGDPEIVRMRLAHWTSKDALDWMRQSTIFETTGEPIEVTKRPYASIWQPTPVFNENENRWELFYVGYKEGGASGGLIFRAHSTVAGHDGIGGPYKELGVVMQPDQDSQVWEGAQGVATFNPFQVGDGKWLAFYGSAWGKHPEGWLVGLASSPSLTGPWKRLPQGNPVLLESVFVENPVVTKIRDIFVAVYDSDVLNPVSRSYFTEKHSVGYATSKDGIHWSKGGRIAVQPEGESNWARDIRTPLGLVAEGNDLYTLVYTAIDNTWFRSVGTVKLKLVQKTKPSKEIDGQHKPVAGAINKLEIIEAEYGVNGRGLDVRDFLETKVVDDTLNVGVEPNNLGGADPAPDNKKLLRVKAKYGEQQSIFRMSDTFGMTITPELVLENAISPKTPGLNIIKAEYGSETFRIDVTELIKEMAEEGTRKIPASITLFGVDPAFGEVKSLTITYTLNGKESTDTVTENHVLELP